MGDIATCIPPTIPEISGDGSHGRLSQAESMTQTRLNAVPVCHVHQNPLDNLDVQKLIDVFVSTNETTIDVLL